MYKFAVVCLVFALLAAVFELFCHFCALFARNIGRETLIECFSELAEKHFGF